MASLILPESANPEEILELLGARTLQKSFLSSDLSRSCYHQIYKIDDGARSLDEFVPGHIEVNAVTESKLLWPGSAVALAAVCKDPKPSSGRAGSRRGGSGSGSAGPPREVSGIPDVAIPMGVDGDGEPAPAPADNEEPLDPEGDDEPCPDGARTDIDVDNNDEEEDEAPWIKALRLEIEYFEATGELKGSGGKDEDAAEGNEDDSQGEDTFASGVTCRSIQSRHTPGC